ncbi:MAG: HD domain-containing protein [Bdellovibrionales bacterium]|nr:HD domain-containing protein [Bdellovibrionales bacterium]
MSLDETQKVKILAIAFNNDLLTTIIEPIGEDRCEIVQVRKKEEFEDSFENYEDGQYAFMVCGPLLGLPFCYEVAQIFNNQCPKTPGLFITADKSLFSDKTMIKNGFDHAFLLPLDKELLKDKIVGFIDPELLKKRMFKNIKIVDLSEDTKLGFDTYVYLPLNKKYVMFSNKDQIFSSKKLEKLKEHNKGNLQIHASDIGKFYDYTAEQLKDLASGTGPLTQTEREEKLQESIRSLFIGIFEADQSKDFNSGREMLENCKNIVSTYITGSSDTNWYNQLLGTMGGSIGGYNHSSNVSTVAGLFAIGMGLPNATDIAIAGFLHDVALSDFPEEYKNLPTAEIPEEYRQIYLDHPRISVNIIKTQKMIISPEAEKAILQHHEQYDGKGFPGNIIGDRMTVEAQILALADRFVYLTSLEEGKQSLTPIQAIDHIAQQRIVSPVLIGQVKKLLPKN